MEAGQVGVMSHLNRQDPKGERETTLVEENGNELAEVTKKKTKTRLKIEKGERTMRTIKCQICGKEVEAKSSSQKYCPECAREKMLAKNKKWRENNKEHRKEYAKEYKNKNKERVSAKKKEYNEKNKEKIAAQKHEYYENNKEKLLARQKERRENDKEKIRAQWKEYYERTKVLADREGNNFCIYIHTDPIGKVYVGRTFGEDVESVNKQRWHNGIGYRQCPRFWEAIQEYGWNNIQHELLEWNLTYEEVLEREQYWIERYDSRNPENGYNVK